MNREEEALELLAEARTAFEALRDGGRVAECELLLRRICQRRGDPAGAER